MWGTASATQPIPILRIDAFEFEGAFLAGGASSLPVNCHCRLLPLRQPLRHSLISPPQLPPRVKAGVFWFGIGAPSPSLATQEIRAQPSHAPQGEGALPVVSPLRQTRRSSERARQQQPCRRSQRGLHRRSPLLLANRFRSSGSVSPHPVRSLLIRRRESLETAPRRARKCGQAMRSTGHSISGYRTGQMACRTHDFARQGG